MDVFQRNGARPATAPGRKIGQGAAAHMGKLGLEEIRNATSLSPQPQVETPQQTPQQAKPPQQTKPQQRPPQRAIGG